MALAPINGTLAPVERSFDSDFDPTRGYIFRYEYHGASFPAMEALSNSFIALGMNCKLRLEGGITMLYVEDPTEQITIDTWEMPGTELSHFVGELPSIITSGMTEAQYQIWATGIQNRTLGSELFTGDGKLVSFAGGVVQFVYNAAYRGATDFEHCQYALRHTTNVPSRWNASLADTNVDRLYTTAELLTETQSLGLWAYPLPAWLAYRINNIPMFYAAPTGYQWGWRKKSSTVSNAAHNRVNLTQEWIYDCWSIYYYAPL